MAKKKRPGKKGRALAVARRSGGLPRRLLTDVRLLIDGARQRVATAVNAELTWLYWQIGSRIRRDVLAIERRSMGSRLCTH